MMVRTALCALALTSSLASASTFPVQKFADAPVLGPPVLVRPRYDPYPAPNPRHVTPRRSPSSPAYGALQQRAEASQAFDIGFQVEDEPLWEGSWTVSGPPIIIPGPPPVTIRPEDSFSLNLKCNDCRTSGEIIASMSNEDDGPLSMGLTFYNVGAHIDLGLVATNKLTVTFTLGAFLSTQNMTTGAFNAKIGLGLDLVLSLTTAAELTGGFEICIPDGSQLGFSIDIGSDLANGDLVAVTSEVDTLPEISISLLPLDISGAANITAALVLKTEAEISATTDLFKGAVGAGASLTLVQVDLGAVGTTSSSDQCQAAVFADLSSSAGAFAKLNVAFNNESLFDEQPEVRTTFASVGTTTCLVEAGEDKPTTGLPAPTTSTPAEVIITTSCPGINPPTATKSLTSCLVPLVNCPASLTQLVIVTQVEPVTSCPHSHHPFSGGGLPTPSTTLSPPSWTNTSVPLSNGTYATATPVITCGANGIALPPLDSPILDTGIPAEFSNATGPVDATVTATTGVPVETTRSASVLSSSVGTVTMTTITASALLPSGGIVVGVPTSAVSTLPVTAAAPKGRVASVRGASVVSLFVAIGWAVVMI